jgi:CRISPR-associated endonuclease Csn1
MKKILGLDLGSASIGWALIKENGNTDNPKTEIIDLGCRIIPYDRTEGRDFSKGTGETRNAIRTRARTIRRGYDRYQMRRKYLTDILVKHSMMPDETLKALPKMQLWELRSKAVNEEISLQELGRILLFLNQKRGYKSSRSEANLDKKETEYVSAVKNRHELIKEQDLTIGQYFFQELKKDEFYRTKEKVFPREAYMEEFDRICKTQQAFHPELSQALVDKIRNEIIYYQRPLKSQKGLVSVCEFAGTWIKKDGKDYFIGPKVAPKSSPLFQVEKIWETINNIKLTSRSGIDLQLTHEQKAAVFKHLDNNEKLTVTDLFKILNLKKGSYVPNTQISKGLQGNLTKHLIRECLESKDVYSDLLRMNLNLKKVNSETYLYDRKTGEVTNSKPILEIDPCVEKEPLYKLWHTIYSINDRQECANALLKNFGIEEPVASKLASIDFSRQGFGNKSAKVIRKILPYLMEGDGYPEAMSYAGYSHSGTLSKEDNLTRKLENELKPIPKNSLRQPVVEKILNQMVNLVNAVIEKYGKPDEIRIELARELKQSREERNKTERSIRERERENETISKKLAEYGLRGTRNNIIKWRLYEEINSQGNKLNAICIYCGKPISLTEAILGNDIDVEHIIPKSKLFDDSQSNKTLAHRHCNRDKNEQTAYDFMKSKSEQAFNDYIERVNMLYANGVIGEAKRDKLLMTETKIPTDFIDRQLRESQYISRKAREILQTVCHNVWATSGKVTSELRYLWGWDDVTMNLQLPKYREIGLTEFQEWESDFGNHKHKKEVIKDWSKRDDQRHHAIDALTIACTKQGYIQRFNTLNSQKTKEELQSIVSKNKIIAREKLSLLEKYIISQRPIPVNEVENAVSRILISYKSGKRVAVKGKRKMGKRGDKRVVQSNIIVPRGALSEESVYGKINTIDRNKPLKYLFENSNLIVNPRVKEVIENRISQNGGNIKNAISSLRAEPLYIDKEKDLLLEKASCFKQEYVIRYKIDVNFNKVDKVIDDSIRYILQKRLNKFGGKPKEAFKDVSIEGNKSVKWYEDEGLPYPINSVRCFTGLSAVVPARKDEEGRDIGFVKPGNNHHIAIYEDSDGNKTEHVCTFWHAVERKRYNLPVKIKDSSIVWDKILDAPEGKYPNSFLERLPKPGLKLNLSIQQNEMFILDLPYEEAIRAITLKDNNIISDNLYRVQKIAEKNYVFRHHLETQIIDDKNAQANKRFVIIQSLGALYSHFPIKVKVDCLGNITNTLAND